MSDSNVGALLHDAAARLRLAGVHSPERDAQILLAVVLGVPRFRLALERETSVATGDALRFADLVAERERRRPVSHLVGEHEFWSLTFHVTPDVLTPRPETERLVEVAAQHLQATQHLAGRDAPVAADVGTGSGCLAVSIAHEAPSATVHAVDLSGRALDVARRNITRHGLTERVTLHRGDLLAPLAAALGPASLDVVVSNPPYVRRSEAGEVDPEVLWEPAAAIFCEGEPAPLYARIATDASPLVRLGGLLLLELPGQRTQPIVDAVAAVEGWDNVTVLPDLAGLPRVLRAVRVR